MLLPGSAKDCNIKHRLGYYAEIDMKIRMFIGALALTASSGVLAAEVTKPEMKMECCCKKDDQGKMACCKDKAENSEKNGHEGHDTEGMNHK